jgi:hypothetical protein
MQSTAGTSASTSASAYNRRFLELLPARPWVRRVAIVRARDACEACRLLRDSYDARDLPPLSVAGCQRPRCRRWYAVPTPAVGAVLQAPAHAHGG